MNRSVNMARASSSTAQLVIDGSIIAPVTSGVSGCREEAPTFFVAHSQKGYCVLDQVAMVNTCGPSSVVAGRRQACRCYWRGRQCIGVFHLPVPVERCFHIARESNGISASARHRRFHRLRHRTPGDSVRSRSRGRDHIRRGGTHSRRSTSRSATSTATSPSPERRATRSGR